MTNLFDLAIAGKLAGGGGGGVDETLAHVLARDVTELVIPEGVTRIGDYALAYWNTLESVEFPSTLNTMTMSIFMGISSKVKLTFKATTPPSIYNSSLPSKAYCEIYVPSESVSAYKSAQFWSNWKDVIQAIPE